MLVGFLIVFEHQKVKGEEMENNKQIAQDVLQAVGGSQNVSHVTHCMTRLRFTLKNDSVPEDEKVKNIKGVLGVARSGGQYQVIIGQNVPDVYQEVVTIGNFEDQKDSKAEQKSKEKLTLKKIGNNILNYLSGSLTPLIPLLMAACLFNVVNSLFGPTMLNLYSEKSNIYILFDFMYDAGFYFFPIYLGFMAAKKLGATPILGAFMGGILISPDFIAMSQNKAAAFQIMGLDVALLDYSQTVLPIILSAALLALLEKWIQKILPSVMTTIFTPFLTLLITAPISLLFLAPLGNKLGAIICQGLIAFGNVGGFVAVAVVAAIWEFLVMGGMHIVIIVMLISILAEKGVAGGILIVGTIATFATCGVAFGAFLRLKDKEEKSTAFGFVVGGFLGGVTEPILYGLCFKYRRTFIGLIIGGLLGGAYAGITDLKMYAFAGSNFLQILGFSGGSTENLVNGIISSVIAMIGGAAATYFLGFSKESLETVEDKEIEEVMEDNEIVNVAACISGQVISLADVKDDVFSTGMCGKGIAIIPDENVIKAPCDAEVTVVMEETKHAVGLRTKNGGELLIHEGIDTVKLAGEGFKLYVKPGDKVHKGDKLLSFDQELLKQRGIDDTTVFLLSNSDDFEQAIFYDNIVAKVLETVVMEF